MNERYRASLAAGVTERERLFAIRMSVFVEEQAVPPEEELDAYDEGAVHFLVRDLTLPIENPDGIVATARLLDKGGGRAKIGRVAVIKEHRGRGVGALLMHFIESFARHHGFTYLMLEAQLQALDFYTRLGYVAEGDIFLDANIEHKHMYKALERSVGA